MGEVGGKNTDCFWVFAMKIKDNEYSTFNPKMPVSALTFPYWSKVERESKLV